MVQCLQSSASMSTMKTCVIVADRSRARLFSTVAAPERHGASPGENLEELESLTDPEGEQTGEQLFSNTRSGTNRSPHGAQFEYDDHRERHRDEQARRFAKRIAQAILSYVARENPKRLVLAVQARMLGLLRHALEGQLDTSLELSEVARDLSKHSARHIHEALARCGALNGHSRSNARSA
jgi:protein required for attachment to host cells